MEGYIDDDLTDANGSLVISCNWKLASFFKDNSGWGTSDSDFNYS